MNHEDINGRIELNISGVPCHYSRYNGWWFVFFTTPNNCRTEILMNAHIPVLGSPRYCGRQENTIMWGYDCGYTRLHARRRWGAAKLQPPSPDTFIAAVHNLCVSIKDTQILVK